MTPGVISFSCPSCHVRLTVPDSMAGVSGPCPRCSATIEAPRPAPAAEPAPTPEAPAPEPTPQPAPEPVATTPPPAKDQDEEATTIRPEPRAKPERTGAKGITAKKSTKDASLRRRQTVAPPSSRPGKRPGGIARILLPVFFIMAGGTIVYVLCYFFLPGGPGDSLRRNSFPPPESPPERQPIFPELPAPEDSSSSAKTDAPDTGAAVPDAPPLSTDGAEAIRSEEILEQFLTARSLEDRLELVDPPMATEAAQGTILEKVLPEVVSLTSETPSFNSLEKFTNYPFRVSFQGGEGSVVEYIIVVRKRADLEPKVAVKPFLDLVGGRLARFAATPVDGTRTFHAIIEAMPRCFEENIPSPGKKFTYKLSACDVGRTTARAYASLNSSLAEQLWTPDSRIRWGKRIRASVTLQWNTTEDPSQPYIELLEIKGLDWNY